METNDDFIEKNGWYGWYSETQKKTGINLNYENLKKNNNSITKILPKSNIYLTDGGHEVEVTEVLPIDFGIENYKESLYKDAVYKGIVVKWIRHVY